MSQNRNKLIQLLVSDLVNLVVHRVMEKSVKEEMFRKHYDKESMISFEVAKRYREKINPVQKEWPEKDIKEIKEEVLKRALNELELRISKGYRGIDLGLAGDVLDKILRELNIKK